MRFKKYNACINGARLGRPVEAIGRNEFNALVRCWLPGNLLWHPMPNAYSRYFAPARPMALGTRAPSARKLPDVYAGLPRDPNTRLAAKTATRLAAVFGPKTTAKLRPNTKPKSTRARHLTLAAQAETRVAVEVQATQWPFVTAFVIRFCRCHATTHLTFRLIAHHRTIN